MAESSLKLLWLEHPVPTGEQEHIWATRCRPVSDVISWRRLCPWHGLQHGGLAELGGGGEEAPETCGPGPTHKTRVLEAQGEFLSKEIQSPFASISASPAG